MLAFLGEIPRYYLGEVISYYIIMDAVHILDTRGRVVFTYGDAPTVKPASLAPLVATSEPGIIELGPSQLVWYSRYGQLHIFVSCASTASPLAAQDFTSSFVNTVEAYYDEQLSVQLVESHAATVYLILNEMLDSGLTVVTEPDVVRGRLPQQTFFERLLSPSTEGITRWASPAAAASGGGDQQSVSSASFRAQECPWRRPDIRHGKEELYVDIIENIVGKLGAGRQSVVEGEVRVRSQLSGIPEVKLRISPALQNVRWHKCVQNPSNETLNFVPPDGIFTLATYSQPVDGTGGVSAELRRGLGDSNAECEIWIATAIDTIIKQIDHLTVTVVWPSISTKLTVRELSATAGDFDAVTSTWTLGPKTPTGWNATLRLSASDVAGKSVQPLYVMLRYTYEGRVPSRAQVKSMEVRTAASRAMAFKGVKFQTHANGYACR